jgi:mannose-1-phosphate guanylyltransferase
MAERVRAFVASSPHRDRVTLVHEETLLGTAGTLIANLGFFSGRDGLLIHADNYCLADFRAFARAHDHRPSSCVMTMMTFRAETPSSCGIVDLDARGVVVGFHEKVANPPGNLANGAVYILSAELLRSMTSDLSAARDFSTEVLPKLIGRIFTYETNEAFLDIGTPEAYGKANLLTSP